MDLKIWPHKTLGNELHANIAPWPVPQPVATKSTALLVNRILAKDQFLHMSIDAHLYRYIP